MTDLPAYEAALVEMVAREIAPLAWAALGLADTLAQANRRKASLRQATAALTALGLLGPSRTHWLAPAERKKTYDDKSHCP